MVGTVAVNSDVENKQVKGMNKNECDIYFFCICLSGPVSENMRYRLS